LIKRSKHTIINTRVLPERLNVSFRFMVSQWKISNKFREAILLTETVQGGAESQPDYHEYYYCRRTNKKRGKH